MPLDSTALAIENSIMDSLDKPRLLNLKIVVCDGTSINIGAKGGIIFLLERDLQRPLQWFIGLAFQ